MSKIYSIVQKRQDKTEGKGPGHAPRNWAATVYFSTHNCY